MEAKRSYLHALPILLFIISISIGFITIDVQSFTIEEATIKEIQKAFTESKLTSKQLVSF
ncbi:conserved hypothetical protein [Ricinus communis]|uniref:Uncharacterized protein n=1 Tax=Ricinus communis TaxID=3988 RepID=B9SQJ9_RICCO|nr:conserved hypothetical protein [Ricinus communis]